MEWLGIEKIEPKSILSEDGDVKRCGDVGMERRKESGNLFSFPKRSIENLLLLAENLFHPKLLFIAKLLKFQSDYRERIYPLFLKKKKKKPNRIQKNTNRLLSRPHFFSFFLRVSKDSWKRETHCFR